MSKKKKSFKSLLIEAILGIVVGLAIVFVYFSFFSPDIIRNFDKYDGICFDYKEDEPNYIDNLYYKQLNDSEARLYRAMYHAAINEEDTFYLESMDLFDPDESRNASDAFGMDFPEYYWFAQEIIADVTYIKDKLNLFEFNYVTATAKCNDFTKEDIQKNKKIIDDKLNEILPTLKGDNDYSTIKNVYEYVINNTEYVQSTRETSDIRAAIINQKGVCSSYSETFQLICNRLGFECYSVLGYGLWIYDNDNDEYIDPAKYVIDEDKDLHEWNLIKLNGNWYWVDSTWGDIEYYGLDDKLTAGIDYSYFLVPDRLFLIDHIPDDRFEYPNCTDESYCSEEYGSVIMNEYNKDDFTTYLTNAFKNKREDLLIFFTNEEDLRSTMDLLEDTDVFFNTYKNKISYYYNGVYNYYYSNNYSLYLYWHFY